MDHIIALQRPRTRRWVSVVAAVVPVVAFLAVFGWFVRSYVTPAMIEIPAPMAVADAPPAEAPAAAAETAAVQAAEPEAVPPVVPPMLASLEFAPPPAVWGSTPAASTDVPTDNSTAGAAIEPGQPIAGLVPLPRNRPRQSVARTTGAVPLPRSRPAAQ